MDSDRQHIVMIVGLLTGVKLNYKALIGNEPDVVSSPAFCMAVIAQLVRARVCYSVTPAVVRS